MLDPDAVRRRALGFDCSDPDTAADRVCVALRGARVAVLPLADVGAALRAMAGEDEWHEDHQDQSDLDAEGALPDERSREWDLEALSKDPMLLRSLEARAANGEAESLYLLALIQWLRGGNAEGSAHWYALQRHGEVLDEVQRQWADSYSHGLGYRERLREAAIAGHAEAALRLARDFEDPLFFERGDIDVDVDPAEIAALAESLGRPLDARRWLGIAAAEGDIEAMRTLIEDYDADDPVACWTWHHLALKLGEDLTIDRHIVINEDGSLWDEDVGGPAHVGGVDGVVLPEIEDAAREQAIREAERLYAAILAD
jgi:hypothetical protein